MLRSFRRYRGCSKALVWVTAYDPERLSTAGRLDRNAKTHNLALDGRVSLTINGDPPDIMAIHGLSLAGYATPVGDPAEAARLIALMPRKYPDSPPLQMPMPTPEQVRIFHITPLVISVLDYSKGFGHTELITV